MKRKKQTHYSKFVIVGLCTVLGLFSASALTGCKDDGFEEVGEQIDEAVEDTADAVEDVADDVGDAIDC